MRHSATLLLALLAAWAAAQGKTPGADTEVYKSPGTVVDEGGYAAGDAQNGTTNPPGKNDGGGDKPDADGDGQGKHDKDGDSKDGPDADGDGRGGRPDADGDNRGRPAPGGGAGSAAPTLLPVLGAAGLAALAV